jgi:hypothetical protein
MDQLVVHNHITRLRRTAEQARVGLEARVEEQTGGRTVESRGGALERLRHGRVAVEQS